MKFAYHTFGTSSGFLSQRIARTSIPKEELGCKKKKNYMYSLYIIGVLKQSEVATSMDSLFTVLLASLSEHRPFRDFSFPDVLLDKELVNGSEFFRTNCFPDVVVLTFPPNFQVPFPPACFHS